MRKVAFILVIGGLISISCVSEHKNTSEPISVYSLKDLKAIAQNLDADYILKNDIEIITDKWEPITEATTESSDIPFTGTLDGNNKTIIIRGTQPDTNVLWNGLFVGIDMSPRNHVATVKNLSFQLHNTLEVTRDDAGLLAKQIGYAKLENIKIFGAQGEHSKASLINKGYAHIGGIAGLVREYSILEMDDIEVNLDIRAESDTYLGRSDAEIPLEAIGGIIGYMKNSNATFRSLRYYGEIDAPHFSSVGGLVGINYADIQDSFAEGTIRAKENVGGIVGWMPKIILVAIETSYFIGSVSGEQRVGGLVGLMGGQALYLSYANAQVNGKDSVGGLLGEGTTTVIESYASGSVKGETRVGAIIGNGQATLAEARNTRVYYDIRPIGTLGTIEGEFKTKEEMKSIKNYSLWDIHKWQFSDGEYPRLYYQKPENFTLVSSNFGRNMADTLQLEFSNEIMSHDLVLNGNQVTAHNISYPNKKSLVINMDLNENTSNSLNVTVQSTDGKQFAYDFIFEYYPDTNNNSFLEVNSCTKLQGIENFLDGNYELLKDLDCSDSREWNTLRGRGFVPIGSVDWDNIFRGSLRGNGHTIQGLYEQGHESLGEDAYMLGLFAVTMNAEIDNLSLKDFEYEVPNTDDFVAGGLIGFKLLGSVRGSTASGTINGEKSQKVVGVDYSITDE